MNSAEQMVFFCNKLDHENQISKLPIVISIEYIENSPFNRLSLGQGSQCFVSLEESSHFQFHGNLSAFGQIKLLNQENWVV